MSLKIEDGIQVNEFLETNCPGVWAAGDVCSFPDKVFQKRRRVDHEYIASWFKYNPVSVKAPKKAPRVLSRSQAAK